MPFSADLPFCLLCAEHRTQNTEHIRVKNIVVVLHINTKQPSRFELYGGKGGQAMSLTKLVPQGAVDDCTSFGRVRLKLQVVEAHGNDLTDISRPARPCADV